MHVFFDHALSLYFFSHNTRGNICFLFFILRCFFFALCVCVCFFYISVGLLKKQINLAAPNFFSFFYNHTIAETTHSHLNEYLSRRRSFIEKEETLSLDFHDVEKQTSERQNNETKKHTRKIPDREKKKAKQKDADENERTINGMGEGTCFL